MNKKDEENVPGMISAITATLAEGFADGTVAHIALEYGSLVLGIYSKTVEKGKRSPVVVAA